MKRGRDINKLCFACYLLCIDIQITDKRIMLDIIIRHFHIKHETVKNNF